MTYPLSLTVNGRSLTLQVEPRTVLVTLLRETVGLTGTHVGCDTAQCGACTILIDGRSAKSCTVLALQVAGADVRTVEGVAKGEALHPIQEALRRHGAVQCGFCTPGIVMAALDLIANGGHDLSDAAIRRALDGNLCRCTGYQAIVAAISDAASALAPQRA
jgi:aerobic carbon-monoxide dehydrogenase small subunit